MPSFGNYDPSTFGWTYGAGAVPYGYAGVPFPQGVANLDAAVIFTAALARIVPGMREPLNAHTDCWGYEVRNVRNSPDKSFHGYGIAIDVNAVTNGQTTAPMSASTTTLPLDTGARVRDLGIEWGGDWSANSPRDPMHLELHLSPAEAKALAKTLTGPQPLGPPDPTPEVPTDMITVVFTQATSGSGYDRGPALLYDDLTRSRNLGSPSWRLVNHLHAQGAAIFAPVDSTDFDAIPLRNPVS